MPFFPDFTSLSRNRDTSLPARVSMLTRAGYGLHDCLIVNPDRELEFKIAVTAGLQDKNSMYITQENLLCFHFMFIIEE